MEVVSNTSSIIFIGKLRILDLTKNIFSKILIPKQVEKELFAKDCSENDYIKEEINKFIKIFEPQKIINAPVDKGEKAAISLCIEKNIKTFLSDDKKARKYARLLKLETIGVVGIILWNVKHRKIKKSETKKLIKKLIDKGYLISTDFYLKIIELIEKC